MLNVVTVDVVLTLSFLEEKKILRPQVVFVGTLHDFTKPIQCIMKFQEEEAKTPVIPRLSS